MEVDGHEVAKQRLAHVLLHKPAGVVTTANDPQGRPTVVDLVPAEPRVVPVGRLDAYTTGVLLLTNDGQLSHRLAHPSHGSREDLRRRGRGHPSDTTLELLEQGIDLEDGSPHRRGERASARARSS